MYEHSLAGVPSGVVGSGTVPMPTGADGMYHQYRVTITPYRRVGMVKISIKEFNDGGSPVLNIYKPLNLGYKPNGREQLRLAVATTTMAPGNRGYGYPCHTTMKVKMHRLKSQKQVQKQKQLLMSLRLSDVRKSECRSSNCRR